jgi:hypothetical protein
MAKKPAPHPLATFASATLLALLSGCGLTPLQINQSNVTSGSVDAVWRLTPSGAGGLQVQVEGYRARSTQHLDENTSVFTSEQTTLTGPLDLRNSATVQRAFLGYNHQLFADQPVRLQWFAGIGWARARWDSVPQAQPPQTYRGTVSGAGPAGGVLAAWQVTPLLALEAAAFGGVSGLVADTTSSIDWAQTELGLALTLAAPVRLRMGWASRSLRASTPDSWQSDLTADTRGPYVRLAFEFR